MLIANSLGLQNNHAPDLGVVFVIEVPVMFMHCLNCAEIIHHQMVIPLVMVKKSYFSWPDVQEENDKFFITCPSCNRRNFFIKEYSGYSGVNLRLSHVEL